MKEKIFYYKQNFFSIPDSANGQYNWIKTDLFRITINDSIEIKVGSTVDKVLKYFPKSFISNSQTENGISKIIIYHVYKKEDLLDITKYCLSYFVISYLTDWNRIVNIQIYDID